MLSDTRSFQLGGYHFKQGRDVETTVFVISLVVIMVLCLIGLWTDEDD